MAAGSEPSRQPTKYRRVLLKVSGEALMGEQRLRHRPGMVERIAAEIKAGASSSASQVCLVIGGGNIFRGAVGRGGRHGARHRRLHGHAGDRHERAGHAERARAARRQHARAVGDPDDDGVRALYPPPRHPPPGEGPGRDLRAPAPATRSSPPTPRRRCAPRRWAATRCSRRTKVDGVYGADPQDGSPAPSATSG